MNMLRQLSLLAVATGLASSCSNPPRVASVRDIYGAASRNEARNPVIVIHGILGARLNQKSGAEPSADDKVVWGAFTRQGLDPRDPAGARAIALPLDVPTSAYDYDPANFDVYPSGPLDKLELSLLFNVFSVDVYANILRTLGAGGYTDPVNVDHSLPAYTDDHYTCFSFFYDWRRDNVENAIRFGVFLEETRARIAEAAPRKVEKLRATGDRRDAAEADQIERWLQKGYRFDVVAHSMGGLIARYFLRYGATDLPDLGDDPVVTWKGAEEIDRLLIVGSPSLGSLGSLERLTHGFDVAFFLPSYGPGLLGTMPSIYQLLPRDRHSPLIGPDGGLSTLSLFDVNTWKDNGWGLFSPEAQHDLESVLPGLSAAERAAQVERYAAWCLGRATHFHKALDRRPAQACPAEVFLFGGDSLPTAARVRLERTESGELHPDFHRGVETVPGDTTVARYSALGDERFGITGLGSDLPYQRLRSPIPWTNVTFLADDHVGLTRNPVFANNSLHILLERPLRRE